MRGAHREIDVRRYMAVPFAEKGRVTDGWDCWGVAYVLYRDILGIELPLYTEQYQSTADRAEIARIVAREKRFWEPVAPDDLQPLDIVVMRIIGQPMHVGVCIGNGKMIQCLEGPGTTVELLRSLKWRNRIVGYYRHTP